MPDMVADTISGKVDRQQREIGKLLGRCAPGDVLVVAEISRLARSTLQVLEIMKAAAGFEVTIHVGDGRPAIGLHESTAPYRRCRLYNWPCSEASRAIATSNDKNR